MSRFGYRRPRSWVIVAIGARILVITALAAVLCFAIGLLGGIVGIALINSLAGGQIGMAAAYRAVAFPAAIIGMITALIGMVITEVRDARRSPAEPLAR